MSGAGEKIMRTWVSVYFAVYLTFSLWAHIDDFHKAPTYKYSAFVELLGNVCLLLPALAYWYPEIQSAFVGTLPIIFGGGVFSLICTLFRGFKKNFPDPKLSLAANVGLSIVSSMLVIAVTSPLLWWGGRLILK